MSQASRQRNEKRPSPCSSKRPRLHGKGEYKPSPFNITEYQKQCHTANTDPHAGGAFGGRTRAARKAAALEVA